MSDRTKAILRSIGGGCAMMTFLSVWLRSPSL